MNRNPNGIPTETIAGRNKVQLGKSLSKPSQIGELRGKPSRSDANRPTPSPISKASDDSIDRKSVLRRGYSEVLVSLLSDHEFVRRNLTMLERTNKPAAAPQVQPEVPKPVARITKKPLDAKKERLAAKRKAIGGFGATLARKKPPTREAVVSAPLPTESPESNEETTKSIPPAVSVKVSETVSEPVNHLEEISREGDGDLEDEILPLVEIYPDQRSSCRKLVNPGRLHDEKLITIVEKDKMMEELKNLKAFELEFMLGITPPMCASHTHTSPRPTSETPSMISADCCRCI